MMQEKEGQIPGDVPIGKLTKDGVSCGPEGKQFWAGPEYMEKISWLLSTTVRPMGASGVESVVSYTSVSAV